MCSLFFASGFGMGDWVIDVALSTSTKVYATEGFPVEEVVCDSWCHCLQGTLLVYFFHATCEMIFLLRNTSTNSTRSRCLLVTFKFMQNCWSSHVLAFLSLYWVANEQNSVRYNLCSCDHKSLFLGIMYTREEEKFWCGTTYISLMIAKEQIRTWTNCSL